MKKRNRLISYACCLFLGFCGCGYYLLFGSPFGLTKTAYICVDADDTADSIQHKVEQAGQPSTMIGFHLMAILKNYGDKHRTGRFAIEPGMNMFTLVRKMGNGMQTPVELVIPSVRTVERMTTVITRQLMMDSVSLAQILSDTAKIKDLGSYTPETLPCLFIPNTYEVYWDISPEKLVSRLEKEHDRFWNSERQQKAKEAGLTPNEVCTLASIVESETNYNPEKAKVAGLYLNRLHAGMMLQSDPTVKFALKKFELRRILHEHLSFDSPYNTYMYAGLPPGPICIPTPAGIDAVLNYEHHNYMYMCAKEDFSGSHNFSTSFVEHRQNALRYQQALNQRGIK